MIDKQIALQMNILVQQPDVWAALKKVLEFGALQSREACAEYVRAKDFHEAAVSAGKLEAFESLGDLIAGIARNYSEGKPPYDN
jgi:hypothetical protein